MKYASEYNFKFCIREIHHSGITFAFMYLFAFQCFWEFNQNYSIICKSTKWIEYTWLIKQATNQITREWFTFRSLHLYEDDDHEIRCWELQDVLPADPGESVGAIYQWRYRPADVPDIRGSHQKPEIRLLSRSREADEGQVIPLVREALPQLLQKSPVLLGVDQERAHAGQRGHGSPLSIRADILHHDATLSTRVPCGLVCDSVPESEAVRGSSCLQLWNRIHIR